MLSQGDRKRLEIACALALRPRLLLLDEPTAGMSPEETQVTINLIERLWRELKFTVLLTEHDVAMVFRMAQRITVLTAEPSYAPEIQPRFKAATMFGESI